MRMRRVRKVIIEDDVSAEEAREYICEARMNTPGEIDAYSRHNGCYGLMLYRQYTIKNVDIEFEDEEAMLEYARDNMPDNFLLDLT